jgi:peptidoglycan endopeptidase LytE
MDAVRSAILTQTAMAEQGISGTYTPTPEVDATSGVEVTSTPSILLASATPTSSVEYVEYTVKPGDWIWQIARDFNVDPQAIIDANQLTNPGSIEVGMVLKIPVGSAPPTATPVTSATPGTTGTPSSETPEGVTIHIVKPGEWIWQIARQYGVDPQTIIDANNLTSSMIYPGDELIIP